MLASVERRLSGWEYTRLGRIIQTPLTFLANDRGRVWLIVAPVTIAMLTAMWRTTNGGVAIELGPMGQLPFHELPGTLRLGLTGVWLVSALIFGITLRRDLDSFGSPRVGAIEGVVRALRYFFVFLPVPFVAIMAGVVVFTLPNGVEDPTPLVVALLLLLRIVGWMVTSIAVSAVVAGAVASYLFLGVPTALTSIVLGYYIWIEVGTIEIPIILDLLRNVAVPEPLALIFVLASLSSSFAPTLVRWGVGRST